jgi:hypothetical protein
MLPKRKVDRNQRDKPRAGGGPRTAAGKRRSCHNAHKHGLSILITADQHRKKFVLDLAHVIAGAGANDAIFKEARVVAECELIMQRIRQARVMAIEGEMEDTKGKIYENPSAFVAALPMLYSFERYERRAYSRRKKALQTMSDLQLMAQLRRELGPE